MTLNGFRPLREFMTLRDAMDRLFEDSFVTPDQWFNLTSNGTGTGYLPLDIYETPDEVVVRAHVPGVMPDNLDVNYQQCPDAPRQYRQAGGRRERALVPA